MKTLLMVAVFLLMFSIAVFAQSRFLCDREWREAGAFPESVYQEFLKIPKTNVGHIDALLDKTKPETGNVIVMVDIRDNAAIFFFRGVPGGNGFAIPEDWPYKYREYVLEIRWLDHATSRWHYSWNRKKLDDTFLTRPELCPIASNAPF